MRAKFLFAGLVSGLVVLVGVAPRAQTPVPPPGQQVMPASPVQSLTPDPNERKLQLTFDGNGYVTLIAHNVTVAEIFAAWAREGGSKIQGADRLPPNRIVADFDKTPELGMIEALVRLSKGQNAGWIASPRLVDAPPTPSRLATISILPSSSPTSNFVSSAPQQAPIYQQNTPDENEIPPVMPVRSQGPAAEPQPAAPPASRGPGAAVPIVGVPQAPPPGTTGSGTGRSSEQPAPLPGAGRSGRH